MVVRSWTDPELAGGMRGCEGGEEVRGEEVVHTLRGGPVVAVVEVEAAAGKDECAEAVLRRMLV